LEKAKVSISSLLSPSFSLLLPPFINSNFSHSPASPLFALYSSSERLDHYIASLNHLNAFQPLENDSSTKMGTDSDLFLEPLPEYLTCQGVLSTLSLSLYEMDRDSLTVIPDFSPPRKYA